MRSILPAGSQELDEQQILDAYANGVTPDRPLVRVNMVTSLDGASDLGGKSIGLSGTEDRRLLTLLRVLADVLLVGAGTLRQENYHPVLLDERYRDWRTQRGMNANPRLVIVSMRLALDPQLRALADAPATPLIITRRAAPPEKRAQLSEVAEVVDAGDQAVDMVRMIQLLDERDYRHILCEGGPHLLGSLTAAGLVDEFCLTTTPALASGSSGRITAGTRAGIPQRFRLRQLFVGDQGELYARYQYCNESS